MTYHWQSEYLHLNELWEFSVLINERQTVLLCLSYHWVNLIVFETITFHMLGADDDNVKKRHSSKVN